MAHAIQLWIDRAGDRQDFVRLLPPALGNVESPCWINDRIYFLKESEGTSNIFSVDISGSGLTQHTTHTQLHVRHASSSHAHTSIVYTVGGSLFLFDTLKGTSTAVDFTWRGTRPHTAPRFLRQPAALIQQHALHPRGHLCAVLVRGRVVECALRRGPVVPCPVPGMTVHAMCYLHDGRLLLTGVSASAALQPPTAPPHAVVVGHETAAGTADQTASPALPVKHRLVLLSAEQAPKSSCDVSLLQDAAGGDLGLVLALSASPTQPRVVVSNHRLQLLLLELAAPQRASVCVLDTGGAEDGFGAISWYALIPATRS